MSEYSYQHDDLLPIDDEGNFLAHSMLLIDENRGIYLPQMFAKTYASFIDDESKDDWFDENMRVLNEGPDHDDYWDAWDAIKDTIRLTLPVTGGEETYTLYEDGDLWGVPATID